MYDQTLNWEIQRVCPREESVYLVNPRTGSVRQISVPGAEDAWIKAGMVIIRSRTGYFWEVEPTSGARRRMFGQQPLL